MRLSKRLSMIASMVSPCDTLCDIGTDHAYLPCALIQNHQCALSYAADIAKGPLDSAKSTIAKYGLKGKVIPILSNGLVNVPQTNTIIIAGMGVVTAIDILETSLDKVNSADQVIVQVNKEPHTFRAWLNKHEYKIEDEQFCYEQHDYVAISFSPKQKQCYTNQQIYLGPLLMQRAQDDEIIGYYNRLLESALFVFERVKDEDKKEEVRQRIEWLKQLLDLTE